MSKTKVTLLTFGYFLLQTNISLSFCQDPMPSIQTELTRSKVAFIGTAVSKRDVIETENGEEFVTGTYCRFRVKEMFRGPGKKFIEIYEDNDSGRMVLKIHGIFLIFIKHVENEKLQGWCDDAREVSEKDVEHVISEIHEILKNIKSGKNGNIRGFIANGGGGGGSLQGGGVSGVHFIVKGGGKVYKAVSDDDGWFSVSVPAGDYQIECVDSKLKIHTTDYSPDNPKHIRVESGGGAEVEYVVSGS